MSSATFAVVVPTYNRAHHVCAAIDSILSQDGPPEEVIVVDDGSTDDTLAVLARYGDRVRIVAQVNGGVSAARNVGAAVATADWLTFLDSDDLWCPGRMTLLRKDLAGADPAVVAHVANVLFKGVGAARDFFSVARIGVLPGHVQTVARPLGMFLHAFFLIGAAFRRDVFVDLGGFDPAFRTDEDSDIAHRLAVRGPFMVRGDVVAEVIRHPGDADALSPLRGRDRLGANDLKQRLFRAAYARAQDPGDRALAAAALSATLLQRAGLIRATGQGGYWPMLWRAVRTHPSPARGLARAVRAVMTGHVSRKDAVDRTAAG